MMDCIASFDIGKRNFAFCIEEFDTQELMTLKPNFRYHDDGTCTEDLVNILNKVFSNGKILLYKNNDLVGTKNTKLEDKVFNALTELLNNHSEYWKKCKHIVVEKQMGFGRTLNLTAIKLAQHVMSYFMILYPDKLVVEFPAYHKTQVLGAPKVYTGKKWASMDKPARKKWSVDKAIEILTSRGEMDILDTLTSAKKRDDLADTFTQLQAYKVLLLKN